MPIDMETFETESGFDPDETNAERIVRFLARNDDRAFERGEIADATGIDPDAVSAVLSRLKDRELVRHKPPYWAIGDRERLASAAEFRRSLASLNERLGTEDMDAWREAGADGSRPGDTADRRGE
jgi:DNA-binding transcriptional ArsR family regulator